MRESMRDRANRDLEHMDREGWAESYGKEGSQRLIIREDQGEGTAFTNASRASVLKAAEPLVGLAVLASRSLVLAIVDDTTTNEGDRVVKLVVPVQFILLQARVANVGGNVVEGCAEDSWRPVAHTSAILTPGTRLALGHTLLIDIVVSRGGFILPEEIFALIGVGKVAGLARANSEWECHGLGPLFESAEMVRYFACSLPG